MNFDFCPTVVRLLAATVWLPFAVSAQTLDITNGVQIYAALTNTTVTMTGRCELRVTATNNPISGCVINLNSADAWLVLPGLKPSVVVASYLGQIRVSGASAVVDGNVRVVQYAAGAVVIPQPPSFKPLQVFSGPHFNGPSAQYSQYVYYTGSGLGVMDMNISSFKLKRGYMAVFAQNTTGSGYSKCYVAQEGDLEVSILPAILNDKVRYIYVTPWRWVSKKGIAGNIESGLNVAWKYNWNLDQNSSRDMEYIPIRQSRWWPGLSQNWQTIGANTVLGYNEPDSSSQANIPVADAIWSWPDLLAPGLRVGSPAVTDGGRNSWLYPFITQADAAGLRVDFVAVHYYQQHSATDPAGCATQLYNFLKATYDQVKRPLWVTEWNQGANWTTSLADPTFAQQQAAVSAMIDMLETTPFVERYSIYNWVEDVRRVKWDDGSLTDAGITYRDKVSALSYMQALPDNGQRSLAQYSFETNALDSSGYGNNGLAVGAPAFTTGHSGPAVVFDGTNNYVQLPPNIASSNSFTFAAWVNWNGGANWQRIFDFGDDTTHYLFLSPSSGGSTLRFAIKNGGAEQIIETSPLPVGQWRHVCVTLSGSNAKLYTNGVLAASSSSFTIVPSSFAPMFNYLGKSQFADPLFRGSLDEVQIADYAFTAAQIAALQTNSPPQFTTNYLTRGAATEAVAYSNNISGTATDPDPGDTLTYSKASGPAWLSISASGILSGTPGSADGGTNYYTMRVTDAAGASAFAVVMINTTVISMNGAWSADASGNWSDATKWSGGLVASAAGYTADFSTLNITTDRTVTLDSSRSLGTLKFSDTSGAQNWNLNSSGGSVLTLNTGSATAPTILVTNTATIAAPLAGTNGFVKTGPGTLTLSNENTITGMARILSGTLKVAHTNALQAITVNLDDGDGALTFGLITSANLGGLIGARNLGLTNSSSLGVALNVGASGNSNAFSGVLSGSGGLVKNGSGIFTLTSSNTYTGSTIINGGTVKLSRDPVLQFTFNNAAGSTSGATITNLGAAGAILNGTIVGSGASVVSGGRYGNALSVNGAGGTAATNIVLVNNRGIATDATGTWTLGYWIKTTTLGAMILYQGNGTWSSSGQTAFLLNANSSSVAGAAAGAVRWAGGFLTGTTTLNDGAWHFITLVDRAGTETIYVDGRADAVTSTMSLVLSTLANQLWIGGAPDSDAGAVKINGLIDEVSLYNRALTLAEIQSLTNNTPKAAAGYFGGQLPMNTALAIASGATLDLGGNSQIVASLTDTNGGGWVTNSGAAPATITLGLNGSFTNTFSGTIADTASTNAISLIKNGTATEILAGANTYRGTTTVNAGTLLVNGTLGTNLVTVSGGKLGGTGVIGGAVNLAAGGTLSPGSTAIGALTINGPLTINGTCLIELDKTATTNDVVVGLSSVNCGGTLTVVNRGDTLAAGDSFQIFSATNYAGIAFTTSNLPPLGVGLAWTTAKLNVNGTLSVVVTASPQFGAIVPAGDGNYIFNGTGAAGINYELEAATNLSTPMDWIFVTNAIADQNGQFQLFDTSATNFPQRFYRVKSSQ